MKPKSTYPAPAASMPGNTRNNSSSNSRYQEQLRICDNEILLIADVSNGTTFTPHPAGCVMTTSDLSALNYDIHDAQGFENVAEKWDVSISELLYKLERMPAARKVELLNHIVEGWAFHKDNLFDFLKSRRFVFSPLNVIEEQKNYFIAPRLASREIVVDREPSHVKSSDFEAILHALSRVSSNNRQFIEEEIGFPGEVGFTTCVETGADDDIVFAQRKGRSGLTRFVRGRTPQRSKNVFVVLKRETSYKYVLITGFVGCKPEPEPWDSKAFERKQNPAMARANSKAFWAGHALVWDEKCIVLGTETKTAPACF